MDELKLIEIIKNNPNAITFISNPTDEMKLLAIKKNGLLLEYIDNPTREMQELALDNNIRAIRYIEEPTEEMIIKAVKGMLPKNKLSRQIMKNLKVYAGAEHPHIAQQPQPFPFRAHKSGETK